MSQKTLLESRNDIRWQQEVQQAFGITIVGRVTTTDGTVTTLLTIPLKPSTTTCLHVKIVARRTGGAAGTDEDGAGYELYGVYSMIGGVATAIGGTTPTLVFGAENQAAWDATLTVSGGNVLVQVTGAVDNTVTWTGRVHLDQVST